MARNGMTRRAVRSLGSGLLLLACSGPKAPGDEGDGCFRAEDCQLGLVCVERLCTSDLSPLVPEGAGTPAVPANVPASDAGAP